MSLVRLEPKSITFNSSLKDTSGFIINFPFSVFFQFLIKGYQAKLEEWIVSTIHFQFLIKGYALKGEAS